MGRSTADDGWRWTHTHMAKRLRFSSRLGGLTRCHWSSAMFRLMLVCLSSARYLYPVKHLLPPPQRISPSTSVLKKSGRLFGKKRRRNGGFVWLTVCTNPPHDANTCNKQGGLVSTLVVSPSLPTSSGCPFRWISHTTKDGATCSYIIARI